MNRRGKLLAVVFSAGLILAALLVSGYAKAERSSTNTLIIVNTLSNELNQDGDCSLREALAAANGNLAVDACPAGTHAGTDTIQFSDSGTVPVTQTLDVPAFEPLIITSAVPIQISGNGSGRIFNVNSGAVLTLDGLSISGGNASQGAGIYNAGHLTLMNVSLTNNNSMDANGSGGGIYNTGVLTITNSTIAGNNSMLHIGGGIFNTGQLSLSDSTLSGNNAYHDGGGIYNSGSLTITNSTLSGNSVNFKGGGLYNTGTISLTNSTLSNNNALNGGGLNSGSGTVFLTNSTLSGNHANSDGGAIVNQGNLTASSVTIAANTAGGFGGGIRATGLGLTLRNTLIASNTAGADGPDCYLMAAVTNGYNLIGDDRGCDIPQASGDLRNLNARLGPLQDNGGPTLTQALLAGSPAIDDGDPSGCTGPQGGLLTTDQRGQLRQDRCDIGAYEAPADIISDFINLPVVLNRMCGDFFDDFSNPNSGWYVSDTVNRRVGYLNGEYNVLLKSTDWLFGTRAPDCRRQNYTVEVDMRWAGNTGASYGLIFGILGDYEQFYSFEVNSDYREFMLLRAGPQGWVVIKNITYAGVINTGQTINHLKVTRQGPNITLFVNGTSLGSYYDNTITGLTGSGVIASSYSNLPNADARFDNFRVTGLSSTASVQALEKSLTPAANQPAQVVPWLPDQARPAWWVARQP